MRYSQRWWVTVAVLFAFAWTVSAPTAQTEEPSGVSAPSSAKVQSDSVGSQSSSDEPEQKQPTLTPNRDTAATADVEMDHRFNELRRELLDDRAKGLDWWLTATAIFLTLLGVAAAILGYFGFKRLNRIESEARENMEASKKHARKAQKYKEAAQSELEEIKTTLDKIRIDREVSEAILLQQQNRTDEAIEKWRSIANITEGTDDGRAAQSWFSIGYLLHIKAEPNFDAAINAYDAALRLNPADAVAYYNRGLARYALSQYEAAIADYDSALRLNPAYAVAYYNRGLVRYALGQYAAAITDYDSALRLNPAYADAYYNRGIVRHALGQHAAAIADYNAALRLNPAYADAYNNRGGARYALGQYAAAITDYDSALRLNPAYADAYYNRGIVRHALGQHAAAIADYNAALRLNPAYADAYNNRGLVRASLDQHDAAIADYDSALRLNSNDPKAYNNRGLAKLQLNRIDEARQDFETALNLAQAMGNAELMEQARLSLENLDKGDAP